MTGRLILDCGAAETRAARLIGDEPVAFWFGPALGDEGLSRLPEFGDICVGRMLRAAAGLRGAFVDIGAGRDAFLMLGEGEKAPAEGARLIVSVRRPPLAHKGALVALDWRARMSAEGAAAIERLALEGPPRVLNDVGVVRRALRALANESVDCIETNSPDAAAALPNAATNVRDDPDGTAALDEAIESAFERTVDLKGGARLIIDETEGGAVIDVDAGAAAAGANSAARVNAAAADILFKELLRRAIGGRVVIDFLPMPDRKERTGFLAALRRLPRHGYECRIGALAPDGLCDLTAPRRRLSLLDAATEADATRPRPGRRFTLDWSAKAAIRRLEWGLKRQTSRRPRLLVGKEIADYLMRDRPQWRARLEQRHGARFAIDASDRLEGRGFDLAE